MVVTESDYCREIEAYLCRKNDGHLIRVVGPSFDLVSSWADQGVPLKVAFQGIDRYIERYYRKGPRRRPVKIDFCEADVLDVFDEWRRAVGAVASGRQTGSVPDESGGDRHRDHQSSLPAHLERVVRRLTDARVEGTLGADFDPFIDRAASELDAARTKAGGLRGDAREALLLRLRTLDHDLVLQAFSTLDQETQTSMAREADEDLAPFRLGMNADAFAAARRAAIDRLVRGRFKLPVVSFDSV